MFIELDNHNVLIPIDIIERIDEYGTLSVSIGFKERGLHYRDEGVVFATTIENIEAQVEGLHLMFIELHQNNHKVLIPIDTIERISKYGTSSVSIHFKGRNSTHGEVFTTTIENIETQLERLHLKSKASL